MKEQFYTQCIGLEMSAGITAAPVLFGVFCFSRKKGAANQPMPGAAALLCWCVPGQGGAGVLSSTFPILGKDKYVSPSITACTASKGGGMSRFFTAPQPRVLVVLHFLCCQNY